MSDSDDVLIGRILDRREVLRLAGLGSLAALAACTRKVAPSAQATRAPVASGLPGCVVRPALTEGPFFVDEKLNRSDITEDRPGVPLALSFVVSRVDGSDCAALKDATVDVWHCDAAGAYSDQPSNNTAGQKFLRGHQVTDANGRAVFKTIYPGWYQGRAVHIHFKIRTTTGHDFTSQLFFDDALSDEVFSRPPYSSRGTPDVRNENDGIFGEAGDRLTLDAKRSGDGYASAFDVGLDLT